MFQINLQASDIAKIANNTQLITTLSELDSEIIKTITTYVGSNSKEFIRTIKSELESQLQSSPPDEFSSFKLTIKQIIELGSLFPVTRAYLSSIAQELTVNSQAYQSILPLGHSYNQPDLIAYNSSLKRFQELLLTLDLPDQLQNLEDHLTLLSNQLPHPVNQVSFDLQLSKVIINKPVITDSQTLTIPSQIHVERIYFPTESISHLYVFQGSSVGYISAHPKSTFRFEDQETYKDFRTNNPGYLFTSNLLQPIFKK